MMDDLMIDSGVAVKWYVLEQNSAEARRVFAEFRSDKLTLLAPDFIYAEFGNIMWKKQAFQNFDQLDAANIVDEFRAGVTLNLTSRDR
jgi:predicted nucleic acid-binding protein